MAQTCGATCGVLCNCYLKALNQMLFGWLETCPSTFQNIACATMCEIKIEIHCLGQTQKFLELHLSQSLLKIFPQCYLGVRSRWAIILGNLIWSSSPLTSSCEYSHRLCFHSFSSGLVCINNPSKQVVQPTPFMRYSVNELFL